MGARRRVVTLQSEYKASIMKLHLFFEMCSMKKIGLPLMWYIFAFHCHRYCAKPHKHASKSHFPAFSDEETEALLRSFSPQLSINKLQKLSFSFSCGRDSGARKEKQFTAVEFA